jgi:hypothetical protein
MPIKEVLSIEILEPKKMGFLAPGKNFGGEEALVS